MNQLHAKENIIEKIKQGLNRSGKNDSSHEVGLQSIYFNVNDLESVDQFITENSLLGVQVYRCKNDNEFIEAFRNVSKSKAWKSVVCVNPGLKKRLGSPIIYDRGAMYSMDAVITECEYFVARTGTVVMSSAQPSGRVLPVYSPVHVIVGHENQMVNSISEALEDIKRQYLKEYPSALYFLTGVSSTGDIEKTLVKGVHGPKEVYIFLIED
ncbi:LutC/YkgG family protein [Membranihabitans maritimus]|uniref:LutC/YkgG family protein n=1 Tax=Membranihabitans maritimus TaxID=2904244 RepID=UPI001F39E839|nr:LUD domain-containing protein [Membranihabitans maritimus]